MVLVSALLAAQAAPAARPSLGSTVLHSLPVDPASVFTLVLMVVFFGFVVRVGRNPGTPDGDGEPPASSS